jgi:DNA-binding CsgD family transcriptional regulator
MRDDVIAAIYDAPLADRPWASLTPLLRSFTNASSLMFKFTPVGSSDNDVIVADAEWDFEGSIDLYRRVYQHKDPASYALMSVGEFYRFEDLVSRDVLLSSDFYGYFCKPLNIEHAFFCYLGRHAGIDGWLYGARDAARGPFSTEEARSIRHLLPHLDRAARTYSHFERQRSETQIYSKTVGLLGIGMVILDQQGSIIGQNDEADAILVDGAPVMRIDNRLRLVGAARRQYTQIFEKAMCDPFTPAQTMIALGDSGEKVSLVLRRIDELTGSKTAGPAFVVYLHRDARVLPSRAVALVAEHLGLTQVEARFTVMLADGLPLAEIARRLGVTPTSARTYCKRVLAKTGMSRQSELVRMVLTSLVRLG